MTTEYRIRRSAMKVSSHAVCGKGGNRVATDERGAHAAQ